MQSRKQNISPGDVSDQKKKKNRMFKSINSSHSWCLFFKHNQSNIVHMSGCFTTDASIIYNTGQLYFNVKQIFMQSCKDKINFIVTL